MSQVRVWNLDVNATRHSFHLTFLPNAIEDGPKDSAIEIIGLKPVDGSEERDFLFDPKKDPDSFDAVHTYVSVRQLMSMYQRALWRIGKEKPLSWQWGSGKPIKVFPRAGNNPSAYYSRKEQCLKFFFYKQGGRIHFTNRSVDIVAHECGHAILDSIRPGYWSSWQIETSAFHESFADITGILYLTSQMVHCEAIVAHSKADLHDKSYFKPLCEQLGVHDDKGMRGLRIANNELTMQDVSTNVHDMAQVFTGAFYDILADIFDELSNPDIKDDANTLFSVGEHMTDLLIEALLRGPPQNATFKQIAEGMIKVEKKKKWKSFIRYHFEQRRILGKNMVKAPTKPVEMQLKKCTCCLASKEHIQAVDDAVRRRQSCLPCVAGVY